MTLEQRESKNPVERAAPPCPKCKARRSRVMDARPREKNGSVWRRRECANCGSRWTTDEVNREERNRP